MNLIDLTIIYLACGAPFGVYHFLMNRYRQKNVWLKSALITLLWIPFAFRLLILRVTKQLKNHEFFADVSKTRQTIDLNNAKKGFEAFLSGNGHSISLFELREIVDRYSGLSLAKNFELKDPANHQKEIFRVTGDSPSKFSAICLNRRNRNKLLSHQKEARGDFLKTINELSRFGDEKKLGKQAIEFVKLIRDDEASASIQSLLKNSSQNKAFSPVKELEKDLWKQDIPKQPTDQPVTLRWKALTATANSRIKD